MDQLQRMQLIERQSRAYSIGMIECINDQWVFFDDETDEATMLEHYISQEIEIFHHQKWIKGILDDDGQFQYKNETIFLFDQMKLRIRKQIIFSLDMLFEELDDDVFIQFISTLNSHGFSVYDCIFCHNHLSFLESQAIKNGVNMLIFDNGESICAVHHHFMHSEDKQDRFEFTLSTGKRIIIDKLNK